jgi:undecaprenyl-phosphate 4-deoxy-4-formamido-L-arabinose transferase
MLNEAGNVGPLLERVFAVLEGLAASQGLSSEVIAVDDGSTDGTLALLREQQRSRPTLRIVCFARNFGQHAAVMAGFEMALGDWILTLDADLQNPPEELPKLVDALRAGHDLVHTWRTARDDTVFRRTASSLNNRLMRRLSGMALKDFGCMLRGYDRRVVAPLLERRAYHGFIPALAMLHAVNPVEIPVAAAARTRGASKYSLNRLFGLALDLMTSSTIAPLRLLFVLGGALAAGGLGFGGTLLALRLIYGPDWTVSVAYTLAALMLVLVGAQFVAFGLLGEYIGRIYQEVCGRKPYLVREIYEARRHAVSQRAAGTTEHP